MSSHQPEQRGGTVFSMLESRLGGRQLTARRAAAVISLVTVLLTVAGGVLIRAADPDNFSSIGAGLWWAVQTLTTVGYGDVVPTNTGGRVIGTIVMLNGIAFLTVITAAVTATLIDQVRRRSGEGQAGTQGGDVAIATKLDQINRRLDEIEATIKSERRAGGG